MIVVTRFNGPPVAINCDLIERIEATPDTVLTLVDGTKYLVTESVQEIIDRIRTFRSSVVALASQMESEATSRPRPPYRPPAWRGDLRWIRGP